MVKLRIGFVLGKDGGALAQMAPVFRAFVGGRLGSGKQWMPWIHVDDVAEMFVHAVESDISGVWNATSPNPVTNAEFTRRIGRRAAQARDFPRPAVRAEAGLWRIRPAHAGQRASDSRCGVRVIASAIRN